MSRRRLGAACVLGAALCASVASAVPARAAMMAGGPPMVTVSPDADLQNGQYIQVSWSNYKPLFPVYMLQCIAEPIDPDTDCTTNTQNGQSLQSHSLADGTVMALFPVSTGTVPEGFTCDETTSCTVYVTPIVSSPAKA